jgi:DNA-binding SARP family transcriptional activator/TolB-like protein/Tfp pilus assembly protein PilF
VVELRILGPLLVSASDGRDVDALVRQSKRTALLAYLAASGPHGLHRRDTLLALFWPESDESHARAALSQALYVLRNALGEQAILGRGDDEVGLAAEVVWCDAVAFEAALGAGKPDEALALYRGDLLEGFFVTGAPEFERWLDRERARLRQRAADGAWALAETKAADGNAVEAERWARWAADLLPADEAVVRRLMTFLFELGDRAAAVRAYEAFAWRLAQEYELEPSAETQGVAEAIRMAERPSGTRSETSMAAPLPSQATGSASWHFRLAGAFTGLVVAAVLALGYAVVTHSRGEARLSSHIPRVLVLPFQNLGAAEDSYFAEGITHEITTRLALVDRLTVVGAQAASRYEAADRTARQLHEAVGADYVLEGTVSWQRSAVGPGRVRVRPELINARDETQIWSAVLDEDMDMTKLFALLSELADRVVREVPGALERPRRHLVNAVPTTNLEAYDYYLRGREFTRRTWTTNNSRAAVQMLERAVARDSNFALARAWLAIASIQAYWRHGLGAEHLEEAERAALASLKVEPDLGDGHLALGMFYYACCEDYERAMGQFRTALAATPGDPLVLMFIGNTYKRQGRWQEALGYYERAATLDPGWRVPRLNLAQVYLYLRRYEDAQREIERALAIEPQELYAYATWVWIPLLRDGDVAEARRVVRDAARAADGFAELRLPFYVELLGRDFHAALDFAGRNQPDLTRRETGPEVFDADDWFVSEHLRQAVVLVQLGDSGPARVHFDSAVTQLGDRVRHAVPHSRRARVWLRSGLALAYAGLGRRAAALEQAKLVRAADPPAIDAIVGPAALQNVALAYVILGERTAALDLLERLVSMPARLSPELLRLDPLWDPLRSDPRFERLVSKRR